MGPRSHERGNAALRFHRLAPALASMGPRSHERGNADCWQGQGQGLALQWGRVLMNAETELPLVFLLVKFVASMGPRSHERGNIASDTAPWALIALQWGRVLMNAETFR